MAGKIESLRLVALPLSRRPRLTYYHAQRIKQAVPTDASPGPGPGPGSGPSSSPGRLSGKPVEGSGLLVRWMNKGTELGSRQWDALGKAPKGNWKWRIYMTGERMMDRIPFEEWALKGIDPALAPKPLRRLLDSDGKGPTGREGTGQKGQGVGKASSGNGFNHTVPFIYPPSLEDPDRLLRTFRSSLETRVPYHRKWMKLNLFLSPLTLPLALIPIVPNLPFFYMLWRSWSHWRALRASEYLQKLLSGGLILPTASRELDEVYVSAESGSAASAASSSPAASSSGGGTSSRESPSRDAEASPDFASDGSDAASAGGPAADGEPRMLLTKEMVPRVIGVLKLNDEAAVELNRAVDQARARLRNLEPGRAAAPGGAVER